MPVRVCKAQHADVRAYHKTTVSKTQEPPSGEREQHGDPSGAVAAASVGRRDFASGAAAAAAPLCAPPASTPPNHHTSTRDADGLHSVHAPEAATESTA